MDEAALRRRLDAVTPEPTDAALAAARRALERRIAADDAPVRAPRRRLVVGGLALAVAATAAVVVIGGPGPAPTASAAVLRRAADAVALRAARTDGYRAHVHRRISSWSGTGSSSAIDTSVLVEEEEVLRPAAEPGVWERVSSPLTPIGAWGPGKAEVLAALSEDRERTVERSDTDRGFWEPGQTEVSPASIAAVPHDPGALLAELTAARDPDSALQRDTERAIDAASDLLGSGLADAGLQAAVYRALERLPGLVVDRRAADIDGRRGVGIGVVTSDGTQRIDLIIDPATGRYLGRTETDLVPFAGAPAGTVQSGTAVYPR